MKRAPSEMLVGSFHSNKGVLQYNSELSENMESLIKVNRKNTLKTNNIKVNFKMKNTLKI